ncbi:MAG: DMT family transporter [Rhizobiaceae bacterium]|nr:DMT family transporter [Rhizobiaceae bacterium]
MDDVPASASRVGDRPLTGILFKVASVAIFVSMQSFIKASGDVPAGQIVFFRSFFAIFPILLFLGYQGELRNGFKTDRPIGHIYRGVIGVVAMGLGFFALTRLPLPEAIALNYAQPLLVVAFSAIFLGEPVRAYRWGAVVLGLIGVVIVSWPKLSVLGGSGLGNREITGVAAALLAAAFSAVAMLQIRNLVTTETSATIVLWFSTSASLIALFTIPFGWASLSGQQIVFLVLAGVCGGVAQIFMTEGYRYAQASTIAPFEYTSLILGLAIGYAVFAEVPTVHMIIGGLIVIGSGIFIIWRERQLGLQRGRARKVTPPQ